MANWVVDAEIRLYFHSLICVKLYRCTCFQTISCQNKYAKHCTAPSYRLACNCTKPCATMNFEENLLLQTDTMLLRPFQYPDLDELRKIAMDDDTWRFNVGKITSDAELQQWAGKAVADREKQLRYTFVIVDKASGHLAGSTAYGNISVVDKRLEIGWTWLGKDFRGTGLNRHCKFLLLHYVFEDLGFERVELKTDALNLRSRQAMRKIGATEEGILRSHTLMHDGRRRDTIYYSILRPEWPQIRETIFADLSSST